MFLLLLVSQFLNTAQLTKTGLNPILDDAPIPPGPFGLRLFLTQSANILNSVWTCKHSSDTRSNGTVWYDEERNDSIHNISSVFELESLDGRLASYEQLLEIRYNTLLWYRVCCNGLCSRVFKVTYKYWNETIEDPKWAMLVMGSVGTYNATLAALRVLQDKSEELENVLWAIPGGIAIEDPNMLDIKKWITWLQIAENVTAIMPIVAAPSQADLLPYNGSNNLTPWFRTFFKQPFASHSLKENWYSFDHRNIHIVCLCTFCDISNSSRQYKWLEKDLADAQINNKRTPWKILMGHLPLYSQQPPYIHSLAKKQIERLLHRYKVDIAVWSHDRWYDRTHPIINGQVSDKKMRYTNSLENVNGTIHLTCGTGGIPLHAYRRSDIIAYYEARHYGACSIHSVKRDLLETSFSYEVVNGQRREFHTIDPVQIAKSDHSKTPHNPHGQYMKLLKTTGIVIVGGAVIGLIITLVIRAFRNTDNTKIHSKMSAYSKARGSITFDTKHDNVIMHGEELSAFQVEDDKVGLLEQVPITED